MWNSQREADALGCLGIGDIGNFVGGVRTIHETNTVLSIRLYISGNVNEGWGEGLGNLCLKILPLLIVLCWRWSVIHLLPPKDDF